MAAHDLPLLRAERARFEQDAVWNAHLTDVMQQSAAANMHQVGIAGPHQARQIEGQLGHALGVTLGFLVAQLEGVRPTFQGSVVSQGKLQVRALQPFEQAGVIDGNGSLGRESFQEIQPLRVRRQAAALKYFQYPFNLAFGHQGSNLMGNEILVHQQAGPRTGRKSRRHLGESEDLAGKRGGACLAATQPHQGMLDAFGAEAPAGSIFQGFIVRSEQEDISGVGA